MFFSFMIIFISCVGNYIFSLFLLKKYHLNFFMLKGSSNCLECYTCSSAKNCMDQLSIINCSLEYYDQEDGYSCIV